MNINRGTAEIFVSYEVRSHRSPCMRSRANIRCEAWSTETTTSFHSPSKTYRQESKSSPRFQTFQQAQHKAFSAFGSFTLLGERKRCRVFFYLTSQPMTVRGKHTPHARSDSLELKCSTQKEQQNRRLCIASRENRVLRVLDRATTHTHTLKHAPYTHWKEQECKILELFYLITIFKYYLGEFALFSSAI